MSTTASPPPFVPSPGDSPSDELGSMQWRSDSEPTPRQQPVDLPPHFPDGSASIDVPMGGTDDDTTTHTADKSLRRSSRTTTPAPQDPPSPKPYTRPLGRKARRKAASATTASTSTLGPVPEADGEDIATAMSTAAFENQVKKKVQATIKQRLAATEERYRRWEQETKDHYEQKLLDLQLQYQEEAQRSMADFQERFRNEEMKERAALTEKLNSIVSRLPPSFFDDNGGGSGSSTPQSRKRQRPADDTGNGVEDVNRPPLPTPPSTMCPRIGQASGSLSLGFPDSFSNEPPVNPPPPPSDIDIDMDQQNALALGATAGGAGIQPQPPPQPPQSPPPQDPPFLPPAPPLPPQGSRPLPPLPPPTLPAPPLPPPPLDTPPVPPLPPNPVPASGSSGDVEQTAPSGPSAKKRRLKHQLFKSDIPDSFKGMQRALMFHIKMLWGLIGKPDNAVPEDPTDECIRQFSSFLSSEDQVLACGNAEASALIPSELVTIPTWNPANRQTSAEKRYYDIPEIALSFVKTTIAKYAIQTWRPDLRQPAYCLYNQACRMSAIDSFRQMIQSGVYIDFQPERKEIHKVDLMTAVYDHTVHVAIRRDWKKERKTPGSTIRAELRNSVGKARTRLRKARSSFITQNKYPFRYLDLLEDQATSDDERDPEKSAIDGVPVYFIRKRPERSAEMESFIRILDKKRLEAAEHDGKVPNKHRVVPETGQKLTIFRRLPKNMPLDYYDPTFFNKLTPKQRYEAVDKNNLVLLPNINHSLTLCRQEKLSDTRFLKLPEIEAQKKLYSFTGVSALARDQAGTRDEMEIDSDSSEDDEADDDDTSMTQPAGFVAGMQSAFS